VGHSQVNFTSMSVKNAAHVFAAVVDPADARIVAQQTNGKQAIAAGSHLGQ